MPNEAEASAGIAAAGRRFLSLFALNDAAKIAACYTEDAQILTGAMSPVRGRSAIESVFKFTNGPGYVRRDKDRATLDRGRYMVVWKRVGGEWQIHRDMFVTGRKA